MSDSLIEVIARILSMQKSLMLVPVLFFTIFPIPFAAAVANATDDYCDDGEYANQEWISSYC